MLVAEDKTSFVNKVKTCEQIKWTEKEGEAEVWINVRKLGHENENNQMSKHAVLDFGCFVL